MSTEVELFDYSDTPSSQHIRGIIDVNGNAQIQIGGTEATSSSVKKTGNPLASFSLDSSGNPIGLVGPGGGVILETAKIQPRVNAVGNSQWRGTLGHKVAGWAGSFTSSLSATFDTTTVPPLPDNEVKCVRLTHNASLAFAIQGVQDATPYVPALQTTITSGMWVRNPQDRALEVQLFFYSGANGTGNSILAGTYTVDPGDWRLLTVSPTQMGFYSWVFGTDAITSVKIVEKAGGTESNWQTGDYLQIGATYCDVRSRPTFLLTCDDGLQNILYPVSTVAGYPISGRSQKQLLDYYGFRGAAYIIGGSIGATGYLNAADILKLQSAGWAIGSHTLTHPSEGYPGGKGVMLLGPYGYAWSTNVGVTFSSASGPTFTCSTVNPPFIPTGGLYAPNPIQFTDVAPTGLSLNTTYYVKYVSGATCQLYLDAALTQQVTSTWSGTANFRYAGSTNDDTAIYADVMSGIAALAAIGVQNPGRMMALPQGGWDKYVRSAIQRAGIKHVRGLSNPTSFHTIPVGMPTGSGNTQSLLNAGGWMAQSDSIPVDGSSVIGVMTAYIDMCIAQGAVGCSYIHVVDTAARAVLYDAFLAYLRTKVDANLIDVVPLNEWCDRIGL